MTEISQDRLLAQVFNECRHVGLAPPPRMTLIEWADEFRQVPSATSAIPGKWKTSTQPAAFGPLAAVNESDTSIITLMAATQVTKTEALLCIAGYFIDLDPSSILFVQPTQNFAQAFSKERFAPMVAATPCLAAKVATPRSRDSGATITHREYPGGSIDFVGANSPSDLASRPKRIVLSDEIDKYPASAGSEGDPLSLAEERASTFKSVGRSLCVRVCSPTNEGTSRIAREYRFSDQRRLFVPCLHCGHRQTLEWSMVHWSQNEDGEHDPDTAQIHCKECGAAWSETQRKEALAALEREPNYGWRQTKKFTCCKTTQEPNAWDENGRSLCEHCGKPSRYNGHAGFHISKLHSSRHSLSDVVSEFLKAKGSPELLQKWTNTSLAECWKEELGGDSIKVGNLQSRSELYGPDDLPLGVKCITGSCDVQDDRLEVQFVGWGEDEESWVVSHHVIDLDPSQPKAWKELDPLILKVFHRRDGIPLRCSAFAIDTGGHHGASVYDFTRKRKGRRIFPIKGIAGKRPVWGSPSTTKLKDKLWLIGVDSAKDAIYGRLKIEPSEDGSPVPGCIHFPAGDSFDEKYFAQLTSERREIRYRMGQPYSMYVLPPGKRNEALDLLVYAFAVRRSLPRNLEANLEYSVDAPELTRAGPTGLRPLLDQSPPRSTAEPYRPPPVKHSQWIQPQRGWFDRG